MTTAERVARLYRDYLDLQGTDEADAAWEAWIDAQSDLEDANADAASMRPGSREWQ